MSLQSCPTLCDPRDGSPPGSPVPGILQARTLEWAAISFSNAWKWKVKVKSLSRVRLLATPWTAAYQAPPSMGFSRQECWSGCHCLLQLLQQWLLISLLLEWNMGESVRCSVVSNSLWPHGLQPTRLLYPWNSPGKNMDWAAIPSSRGSSPQRHPTKVSCTAGRFFTVRDTHLLTHL